MIEEMITSADSTQKQQWSEQLQRRVMRLLLQHDKPLFRNQFRHFFADSKLPTIPLLQQYDRYIRLITMSNELLDGIMPRIRRQLSLKTNHIRLHEEAPTRGDIDWPRTMEKSLSATPGLPPLQFETRLRQRTMETPENMLTVAVLLAYRRELQFIMSEQFTDENLTLQEKQAIVSADERAERELAAPYARTLTEQARKVQVSLLAQKVLAHLRPGPSPYRDLLAWWQRFSNFRLGRATSERTLALVSRRDDEKTDAWLYELWIMLEIIHLLQANHALEAQDMKVASDLLQCTFTWQGRRFRLLYNRQLDTMTSYRSDWKHGPPTRPDYAIERETPVEILHKGTIIWREPPIVLDAKYYLGGSDPTNTHAPLKKLLGDMTLLGAEVGALFFPRLSEPQGEQQITRTIRRSGKHYYRKQGSPQQVHLYHLAPSMPFVELQQRLQAMLDLVTKHLPERPQPTCQGICFDQDTMNASQYKLPEQIILCPKPHISADTFDLVNVHTDCLKNPYLCHIIGQAIVPPFVLRSRSGK